MIERIIENWLTNVNEKSFQVPFCQMLISEGYNVVHLSRHGSYEEGKDVLAISPDGTPCAYQLKGSETGKISQKEWAKYYDQIVRLVEIPIKHPRINETKERNVYFVTNGELDEEVRVEITSRNSDWKRRKHPQLGTILKGELLTRFTAVNDDLWPLKLQSEKELLELYLANGAGYLDKGKYSDFLENLFGGINKATRNEGQRILASSAIFASYALSPFTKADNHVAIIEGWTIFIACAISFIEKHKIGKRVWRNTIQIAEEAIEVSLLNLCEEVKSLNNFVVSNPLTDAPFYHGRLTWLTGFISAYVVLQKQKNNNIKVDEWYSTFLVNYQKLLFLWGEAATPQLLATYWALKTLEYSYLADQLLCAMLTEIIEKAISDVGIPDPYHNLGEVILSISGLSEKLKEENFSKRSYSLDSLIQLLTRRKFRGVLEENWKKITLIHLVDFEPENAWQFCTWHCDDGILHETMPKTPQSWKLLVEQSNQILTEKFPAYFRHNPVLFLIFLIVYPHRLRPDAIKFLDDSFLNFGDKKIAMTYRE